MSMDWSNERYVRVYTRDTDDWLVLSWEAQALWLMVLRKLDRAGVLETRRGARGIAALVRMPVDVVERALAELVEDGCLRPHELGYVAPNFIEAQETPQSDRQRKAESRARRRDRSREVTSGHDGSRVDPNCDHVTECDCRVTNRPVDVTRGHAASRGVTRRHSEPDQTDPDQISEVREPRAGARDPGTPGPAPLPGPGHDRVRAWTLDLRRRRLRIVESLRAEGLGAQTPAPTLMVDASVEAKALHLVQRWAAAARELGQDVELVLDERGGHLLAVLEAQCRARGNLASLREETCWSPEVVGWAENFTPEDATALEHRHLTRKQGARPAGAPPKGPARPIEDYPEATELRRIGDMPT
jgi:hypothetical protein